MGGICIHVVAGRGLGGPAGRSPVGCDDSVATLAEEQHLSVPVVRGERPSVTEHDGLALSPVLVVNLRSVLCGNRVHEVFLLGWSWWKLRLRPERRWAEPPLVDR